MYPSNKLIGINLSQKGGCCQYQVIIYCGDAALLDCYISTYRILDHENVESNEKFNDSTTIKMSSGFHSCSSCQLT